VIGAWLIGRIILNELQSIVSERKESHVRPELSHALDVETDWCLRPNGVDSECRQGIPQLFAPDSANELHSADVVPMQTHGKLFQHGVQRVGRNAFDYQLPARDSDRQRLTIADEERSQSVGDSVYGSVQKRMALRVYRVLVQRDRQLDEKIGELAR
jgi:hypothetical protein